MEGPVRPGGYRMHRAIMVFADLATPHWADVLNNLRRCFLLPDKTDFKNLQLELWTWLVEAAERGQVVFMGMLAEHRKRAIIDTSLLKDSKPNFDDNTLNVTGTMFHMIRVFRTDPAASADTPTASVGRPSSAPLLIVEMQRRWQAGCMLPKIGQEAAALRAWLVETHPGRPKSTLKSVAAIIRSEYRNLGRRKP